MGGIGTSVLSRSTGPGSPSLGARPVSRRGMSGLRSPSSEGRDGDKEPTSCSPTRDEKYQVRTRRVTPSGTRVLTRTPKDYTEHVFLG